MYARKEVEITDSPSEEWKHEYRIVQDLEPEFGGGDHIIKMYKSYVLDNKVNCIMPFADGNLYEYLQGKPDRKKWGYQPGPGYPLHENGIWEQLIGVLDALHKFQSPLDPTRRGYHSDLKPQNILVFDAEETTIKRHDEDMGERRKTRQKGGRLVITDFGQAHIGIKRGNKGKETTFTQQRPGTNIYLPPECDTGDIMNTRYDVWPMGCILTEVLVYVTKGPVGVKALEERRRTTTTDFYRQKTGGIWSVHPEVIKYLDEIASDLHSNDLNIFKRVRQVIDKMLEIEPGQRSTCGEACTELKEIFDMAIPLASDQDDFVTVSPRPQTPVLDQHTREIYYTPRTSWGVFEPMLPSIPSINLEDRESANQSPALSGSDLSKSDSSSVHILQPDSIVIRGHPPEEPVLQTPALADNLNYTEGDSPEEPVLQTPASADNLNNTEDDSLEEPILQTPASADNLNHAEGDSSEEPVLQTPASAGNLNYTEDDSLEEPTFLTLPSNGNSNHAEGKTPQVRMLPTTEPSINENITETSKTNQAKEVGEPAASGPQNNRKPELKIPSTSSSKRTRNVTENDASGSRKTPNTEQAKEVSEPAASGPQNNRKPELKVPSTSNSKRTRIVTESDASGSRKKPKTHSVNDTSILQGLLARCTHTVRYIIPLLKYK